MEAHISRIEASKEFKDSLQLRRLLRFLARAALTGEPTSQYRIAVEAFGRPASFDPTSDPIVRVEIRRLRARLADFYRNNPGEPFRVHVPERSYSVVLSAAPAAGSSPPRVAVLPFRHEPGDPVSETLSEGLADDLIYYLRPDPTLTVLARTSVFSLARRDLTNAEIAALVAAHYVLDGAIYRRGDSYHVHAALYRGLSPDQPMDQIWHEEWVCGAPQIPGLAALIGAAVRQSVSPHAGRTHLLSAAKLPAPNAHLLYLQGYQLLSQRRPETVLQAIDILEKAAEEDPTFLKPRIGLLETIIVKGLSGFEIASEHSRTLRLLEECTEIDPHCADTLVGRAIVKFCFQADWPGALDELSRAVEREPHNVLPYAFYTLALTMAGRHDDAFEATRQALRLDPLSPVLHSRFGVADLHCGRPREAIESFQDAIEQNPEFVFNYYHQAMALASVGQTDAALVRIGEAEVRSPSNPIILATKGYVLARAGSDAAAAEIASRLESLSAKGLISPILLAFVYCGGSDLARAAEMVRLALRRKSYSLLPYLANSMMEPLRQWEGFPALLSAARLPVTLVPETQNARNGHRRPGVGILQNQAVPTKV